MSRFTTIGQIHNAGENALIDLDLRRTKVTLRNHESPDVLVQAARTNSWTVMSNATQVGVRQRKPAAPIDFGQGNVFNNITIGDVCGGSSTTIRVDGVTVFSKQEPDLAELEVLVPVGFKGRILIRAGDGKLVLCAGQGFNCGNLELRTDQHDVEFQLGAVAIGNLSISSGGNLGGAVAALKADSFVVSHLGTGQLNINNLITRNAAITLMGKSVLTVRGGSAESGRVEAKANLAFQMVVGDQVLDMAAGMATINLTGNFSRLKVTGNVALND